MMHKVLNNKAPECLTETFAPLRDGSIYNLRGSDHNVAPPKANTEYLNQPTNLKSEQFITFRRSLRTVSLQILSS